RPQLRPRGRPPPPRAPAPAGRGARGGAPPPGGRAAPLPPARRPELGLRGSGGGHAGVPGRVGTPVPEPDGPVPALRVPRRWWQPGCGGGSSSRPPPTVWVVGCDDEGNAGAGQTAEPLTHSANSSGRADIGHGQRDPSGRSEND